MSNENSEMNSRMHHPLAAAYLQLLRDPQLWSGGLDAALRIIVDTVNAALGIRRTGVWSFGPGRETLTLVLGYDSEPQNYEYGTELQCTRFPEYFSQLENVQIEAISDIHREPRLREFIVQGALDPNVKATLSCTIRVADGIWGVLIATDYARTREWTEWERWFITSVATFIAQLIVYAEAHRNEHWLRFIADNLPIGVLKFDLDARCEYANPQWRQLTGTEISAALGEGWLSAVHEEDRAALLDRVRMVGVSGDRDDGELRLLGAHQTLWVACALIVERNVEGLPIGVLGTFIDVTHERKLRENERRYRTLFDNSGDAIFLVRGDCFIDCNERALEMFGCTRAQIIGESPYRFSPSHQLDGGESRASAIARIDAALRGEQQFFEWRHARYDGSEFPAEVTLTGVMLNDEMHLLGNVRDISARKAAEAAVKLGNERLHRINSIAARLNGLRDVEALARASVQILSEHGSAPSVRFFVYDAAAQSIALVAERDGGGRIVGADEHPLRRRLDTAPSGELDVITDIDSLVTSAENHALLRERNTQCVVSIWLRSETEYIGLIVIETSEMIAATAAQREDLLAIGKAVSTALSNVLYISRIKYQANHDMLTGLPNRSVLQRELEALGPGKAIASAFMLLDLDRFKEVNDTLGHHVGDQLLITLAQRLGDVLRERNAFLCRLGGDEFAILLRDCSPQHADEMARVLLELLRQPFLVEDLILEIGGSIGIALFPQQAADGIGLLRLADVAMYEAKRNGSGYAFYDREYDSYTPDRLALMQELRGAMLNKQLVLHYQPRLQLRDRCVVGFEALVRWQHPQRGLLAPAVFLPLAEMNDVIHALTIEVLEQALAQQREWMRRGWRYSISVNLSARNLINEQCFEQLRLLLEKYGTDPHLLELEITETALMHDPLGASKMLASLAALGVRFAIDDFGTGYSSLAYLRQLPIDALKIDRAFVRDMVRDEQDAMIVKSTIALGHNLKLAVVAEGVEDAETLELLAGMGCEEAQGYFISRPQPAAVIEQWLLQTPWAPACAE